MKKIQFNTESTEAGSRTNGKALAGRCSCWYAEGVLFQSPGQRRQPRHPGKTCHTNDRTLKGFNKKTARCAILSGLFLFISDNPGRRLAAAPLSLALGHVV